VLTPLAGYSATCQLPKSTCRPSEFRLHLTMFNTRNTLHISKFHETTIPHKLTTKPMTRLHKVKTHSKVE